MSIKATELRYAQQLAGFLIARRRKAVFAGGDARQRHQLPPAEGRPRGGEFLADRAVVLFGVQRAVFADRVLHQQIEDWPCGQFQFAVAMHHGARPGLVVALDRFLGLAEQRLDIRGIDLVQHARRNGYGSLVTRSVCPAV